MKKNNVSITVDNQLCTGCGVCEDVCPTQSIVMRIDVGENHPLVNQSTCLSPKCGLCIKACPGLGMDLKSQAKRLYGTFQGKEDKYIGNYVALYTGYSLDTDIRYHSASGGMVTQFLIFLLEKKIIDGAVVTKFGEDHISPETYIARTKEEILKSRSSKYCPVSLNKIGNEIKRTEGKFVVVGLPCHIQGFRKREQFDRQLHNKIIGYFSIYCSSNRNFYSQEFLLNEYNLSKKELSYFAYRDNGCLGNMVIKSRDNEISVPYVYYYGRLRSFFKPRRCLTCIDHYGDLADVSFGDIYISPYNKDKVGINSCIVRNKYFNTLLLQAKQERKLDINPIDCFTLNESQKTMLYSKKRKARALMEIDNRIGRKNAFYDEILPKPYIRDYFSVIVTNIQRYIGRHRSLWFIIHFLYNKK